MYGDIGTQLGKELSLKLADAFLCVEDEGLIFFQIRRDVALTVSEGLFANIVSGDAARVGVSDLDIVAGAFVVADFEVIDAGASPLALLQLGHPLLPIF